MVKLYVNYWSGDFYVGEFDSEDLALEYFENHKFRYRDYRGEKFGFPFGSPYCIESV